MNTSFWTPYISDSTIKAICWTLVHSLWIGMVIALFAGLVITFTRKSAADLRYRLLCGVLVLFVLAVSVTYFMEWRSARPVSISGGIPHTGNALIYVYGLEKVNTGTSPGFVNQAISFLNQHTDMIFLVWLLFFMLKSMNMAGGLLYIQRIRNYKVHAVSEELKHKIDLFAARIGIRQIVSLVQSELVKVPVAVGWLKPVILLPMGIVLQLSTEQLESILWHELAHIRRRDYLVNILQGLVETVFFFNPGLLWLSSLIRTEREACCDDMVLSRMNRKANYLEALLAFGYEDVSRTNLAMSIGSGNQLRDRLKRMVNQENKMLNVAEKAVLAIGLVLLSAFTTLPKANETVRSLVHAITKKEIKAALAKYIPNKPALKNKPVVHHLPKLVRDTTTNKPDTTIHFMSVLFDKNDEDIANCKMNAKDTKGNIYHMVVVNDKLTSLEINDKKVSDDQLQSYDYLVRSIGLEIAEKRRVMKDDYVKMKANSPQAKFKYLDTDQRKLAQMDMMKRNHELVQKLRLYEPAPRMMKNETMRKRMQDDSSSYLLDLQRAQNVITDLVSEKVVSKPADVKWFGLSETELIVNGQKQPDALQQKLKIKYGIRQDYGLYYGPVQMTGTGVFIDVEARESNIQKFNLQRLKSQQDQMIRKEQMLRPKQFRPADKEYVMQQRLKMLKDGDRIAYNSSLRLQPVISDVIADLVSENIVKDKSDLSSFKLTNTFLLVNGVKQSDEMHEKLKTKYLAHPRYLMDGPSIINDPHYGLHYDKSGSMGIGISVDRGDPQ